MSDVIRPIIVDTHGIGHAGAHTTGHLMHENEYVGVIYSFFTQLANVHQRVYPDCFIFAWDSMQSHRRKMYPDYKNTAAKQNMSPDDLAMKHATMIQLAMLRDDILPSLGFKNCFKATGYEADDIMASVATYPQFTHCTLMTSDQDLYQVISDTVDIYDPRKHIVISKKKFMEVYKVTPEQWALVKALGGCTSDNVKGAVGVGEKKAIQYITDNMNPNSKTHQKIKEFIKSDAFDLASKLVTLPLKPLSFTVQKDDVSLTAYTDMCKRFGFKSLLSSSYLSIFRELFQMR